MCVCRQARPIAARILRVDQGLLRHALAESSGQLWLRVAQGQPLLELSGHCQEECSECVCRKVH